MKSRVLVIDDERSLCEVVKQGLELLGLDTLERM